MKWTKEIHDLEAGALYVMTNRGKWHVDIFPKDGSLVEDMAFIPDTWRGQFIGHPETLYYGPIPWPAVGLRHWPTSSPPPLNVTPIKKK